jgi:hypothetical protein
MPLDESGETPNRHRQNSLVASIKPGAAVEHDTSICIREFRLSFLTSASPESVVVLNDANNFGVAVGWLPFASRSQYALRITTARHQIDLPSGNNSSQTATKCAHLPRGMSTSSASSRGHLASVQTPLSPSTTPSTALPATLAARPRPSCETPPCLLSGDLAQRQHDRHSASHRLRPSNVNPSSGETHRPVAGSST